MDKIHFLIRKVAGSGVWQIFIAKSGGIALAQSWSHSLGFRDILHWKVMQKQPQYVVDLIESEMQGKPGVELLCPPQSPPPPPPHLWYALPLACAFYHGSLS